MFEGSRRSNRWSRPSRTGTVDYGMLPVENTPRAASMKSTICFPARRLSIVGEEVLRVEHCLLGVEEVPLATFAGCCSHPQALAECMKFLAKLPNCQPQPYADTAMAVEGQGGRRIPRWPRSPVRKRDGSTA